MRLSVPRLGGITRRGGGTTFPLTRSRPALQGRDAARAAAHNARKDHPGSQWAEPNGPYAEGLARRPPQDTNARKTLVR